MSELGPTLSNRPSNPVYGSTSHLKSVFFIIWVGLLITTSGPSIGLHHGNKFKFQMEQLFFEKNIKNNGLYVDVYCVTG